MPTIAYAAYGSNLHPFRLTTRVPSARLVGTFAFGEMRLVFHKRSDDGSGKCTLLAAPSEPDSVHFALYELDARDKGRLDELEGLHRGYLEQSLKVTVNGTMYLPSTYTASSSHLDGSLIPYDWYKEMVLLGAKYHRFPEPYVSAIEAITSARDSKRERAQSNWNLVEQMRKINLSIAE